MSDIIDMKGKYCDCRHCSVEQIKAGSEKLTIAMSDPSQAIWLKKGLWDPNEVIDYHFIGGTEVQRDQVRDGIKLMEAVAPNLKIEEKSTNARVRISFVPGGTWSYVGKRDILLIPQTQATMNIGWYNEPSGRHIVHEWFHTFGVHHEQFIATVDDYDIEATYEYFAKSGWDKDLVDRNILYVNRDSFNFDDDIDLDSIMLYYLPCQIMKGGTSSFCGRFNTVMSTRDIEKLNELFPNQDTDEEDDPVEPPKEEDDNCVIDFLKTFLESKVYLYYFPKNKLKDLAEIIDVDITEAPYKRDIVEVLWGEIETGTVTETVADPCTKIKDDLDKKQEVLSKIVTAYIQYKNNNNIDLFKTILDTEFNL